MRQPGFVLSLAFLLLASQGALAQSIEDQNGCLGTTDDPCTRTGSCSIQGATWSQTVTIDRADLYDTMGWAGLCDQVHVALVQGQCSPGGATISITAYLDANSFAFIPEIIGPLACNGEPAPIVPAVQTPGLGLLGLATLVIGALVLRVRPATRGAL